MPRAISSCVQTTRPMRERARTGGVFMKKDHPDKRVAVGASASLICYLGLTALLALLLTRGTVGESAALPCILAFASIAAFAGGKLAAHGSAERWMSAASAGAFWAVVVLSGFLANDTLSWSRAGELAIAAAIGAALACVRTGKGKRPRKRRSRK